MISELGYKSYITMITLWSWWWEVNNEQDKLARTILTIFVATLVLLWYKWMFSYSKEGTTALLPPGPKGLPVVGYLPFLGSNLHEVFTMIAHKYGPIFSLQLGTFSITYGGQDVAWSNNSHWRNMRKLLVSQVLSNANMKASQNFRTREVRKIVNKVYGNIGNRININHIAFKTEVNVVTSMLWGCSKSGEPEDYSYIGDGFREVVFKIIELIGEPNISDFIPILSWFDLQGKQREMLKQKQNVDMILDNIIEERINANSGKTDGAERKDFLQILLDLREQNAAVTSINIDQIKALLMDILVAATDTTSAMVEWVMAEILHNPSVKTKIQEELTTIIGMNSIVDESRLPKLTYLDAVIKETFRLHPPLPLLIQRCPNKSVKVGGYTIPKDTIVYMNTWAIHRDPQNWTNPLEFKPERFFDDKWDYSGNDFKFLPFGSGRRICPGIPLGEKMLTYILASLLHSFEWRLPKDEVFELSDKFGFVMKKRKPLIAIPSQRLSDESLYLYMG
uniref:7-ethoxycoumarin O-deethylase-like isoform X2 n=1 Tax=Erigeron canadensis TaxID=72917 RepID=UPI001CB97644|nr:7-ethoxycoumarin O-deethylase-like isoform X2 [Erigeron canadensis]